MTFVAVLQKDILRLTPNKSLLSDRIEGRILFQTVQPIDPNYRCAAVGVE